MNKLKASVTDGKRMGTPASPPPLPVRVLPRKGKGQHEFNQSSLVSWGWKSVVILALLFFLAMAVVEFLHHFL